MSPALAKLAQQVGVCVSFQTWGGESEICQALPGLPASTEAPRASSFPCTQRKSYLPGLWWHQRRWTIDGGWLETLET